MKLTKYPKYPSVKGSRNNILTLDENYLVNGTLIPKGTVSDGLTLKARTLRVIVSRYSPKFMPFFFLHDYLCELELYERADEEGEEILFEIEDSIRTRAMMSIIKLYHRLRYKKGK